MKIRDVCGESARRKLADLVFGRLIKVSWRARALLYRIGTWELAVGLERHESSCIRAKTRSDILQDFWLQAKVMFFYQERVAFRNMNHLSKVYSMKKYYTREVYSYNDELKLVRECPRELLGNIFRP